MVIRRLFFLDDNRELLIYHLGTRYMAKLARRYRYIGFNRGFDW